MCDVKKCKLCGSANIDITYNGVIRDGSINSKTKNPVQMYQCKECGVIWHEDLKNYSEYYESETYRKELENTSEIADFYVNHDFECLDKFNYTGCEIFRDKIVADIGCGGGGFLDYLSGVAKKVIGIEPSEKYRTSMEKRKIETFSYAEKAAEVYKNQVDVVVSFDVIEHVENPVDFLADVYNLLKEGGQAIIGTPTDAPVMRELLGTVYEENLLFSTQHIWVLGEKSLKLCAKKAGFTSSEVKYKQRYGMGNMISWLINKKAMGHKSYGFITDTMDSVWRGQLEAQGLSDYVLIYLHK